MTKMLFKSFGYKTMHTIVLTLYAVLLIPILLSYWELKIYGAWIALYTVFNIIQVVEFGHATFVGNQFNAIVKTAPEKAKTLLGSALRANMLTGFIQLAIVYLLFISGLLKGILNTEISDSSITIVLTILFLYRMVIGSFKGIVVKILNPYGLIYKSFQFATFERLIDFLILVIAAVIDISLIELAIVWFCVKSLYSIVVLFELKKLLPQFFPWWKFGNFTTGLTNFKRSIPFIISNFLERLRNDGVVLIISAWMGITFLPLFVATRTIVNFGLKITEIITTPLSPELINLYAQKKLDKILNIFKIYWFATGLVLITGYTISLLYIEPIFTYWTKGKLLFNPALYCALIMVVLVQNYGKIIYVFFTGINKTNVVLTASIVRVLILLGVIFTFYEYGLYGVLLGMFVSELIVNSIYLPYQSFQFFSLSTESKIHYFLNLITILYLACVYYLYITRIPSWVIVLTALPIATFLFYQYKAISRGSKVPLLKRLNNLVYHSKKENNGA